MEVRNNQTCPAAAVTTFLRKFRTPAMIDPMIPGSAAAALPASLPRSLERVLSLFLTHSLSLLGFFGGVEDPPALPPVRAVTRLNSEKTQMLRMTPAKAVRLTSVELKVKPYPEEKVLPEDGLYRYLYQPGELEGGDRRRATDMMWSWNTFRLDRIVENPGQRVLYYLAPSGAAGDGGGPKRAFVREELMQIPEGTEVPPEWVKEW